MANLAIEARNLSKKYHIGVRQERYSTLRDTLAKMAKAPFAGFRNGKPVNDDASAIWALRDLDFEIKPGEVVGVIGRNGAGKSTLLKILSRITDPSSGFARIRGRLGSMLEVGTGFHLELTGRENIYLNGAILGMRRQEIDRKFDAMVDFSGVDKFIDTPVKHYSSGMYLRLAFAVAAHLEPEILLVDEVLAVGDLNFQKKCLGKMGDVASEGRTILFVSHNLGAIKELCSSSLVLNNGTLDFRGPVVEGIARYSRSLLENQEPQPHSSGWRAVRINGQTGTGPFTVNSDEPLNVDAQFDLRNDCPSGFMVVVIEDSVGDTVVHQRIELGKPQDAMLAADSYIVTTTLPALWIAPGVYTLYMKFWGDNVDGVREKHTSDRVLFDVPGSIRGLSRAVLAPSCEWQVQPVNPGASRKASSYSLS